MLHLQRMLAEMSPPGIRISSGMLLGCFGPTLHISSLPRISSATASDWCAFVLQKKNRTSCLPSTEPFLCAVQSSLVLASGRKGALSLPGPSIQDSFLPTIMLQQAYSRRYLTSICGVYLFARSLYRACLQYLVKPGVS
jgi:hypothetical protein